MKRSAAVHFRFCGKTFHSCGGPGGISHNRTVLDFLYHTVPGRMLLKLLVCPGVSKAAGFFLSSGLSAFLVPWYVGKHQIDMREMEIPEGGFSSFNAFFTRKRKEERISPADGSLISPCDGFLSCVEIRDGVVFDIKNTKYSLRDLLKDDRLVDRFRNGMACIFRLTPSDYHRYCYAADGRILFGRRIPGKLHCVRPVALRNVPVFVQNSREYQAFATKRFGTIVQMEVGALLVGKIHNHNSLKRHGRVKAGDEKGYFEFGGSTIILLLEEGAVRFREALYERQNEQWEMPVRLGEVIGVEEEERLTDEKKGQAYTEGDAPSGYLFTAMQCDSL